jgi:tetratricopeptide (TPR) repeat protein
MSDRIQQLHAMLEREPNDTFCLYGLAMEHSKLGQFDQAIAYFDRTIALNPAESYAYFHKAKVQEQAEDIVAARETLRVGLAQARAAGDAKAANEIASYLDELS